MKKIFLIALSFAALCVSCTKADAPEDSTPEAKVFTPRRFTAFIDEEVKTCLQDNAVCWYNGDAISIFDEAGTNFKFVAESAGASTCFTQETEGELVGTTFYAVYPYSSSNTISSGVVTVGMKDNYSAKAGSFTSASGSIMTAKTTSAELHFKNLTSLVKFTIPEGLGISQLYFFGAGSSSLVGTVSASIAEDGTPTVTAAPAANGGVTITPNGNATFEAGTYYMPVLPGTYTSLRVKITYAEGTVKSSYAFSLNSFTASRSKIANIGTIYDGRKWFKWLTFEDGLVPSVFTETGGTLSIVDNPVVGNANPSAKALLVEASGSGYIRVDLKGINSSVRASIKSIKFHYKPNGTKFAPRVRFNSLAAAQFGPLRIGSAEAESGEYTGSAYGSMLQSDYWNVLEFTASQYGKTDFSDIENIQIRPLVWTSGSDNSGNPASVYIDNIGFSFE